MKYTIVNQGGAVHAQPSSPFRVGREKFTEIDSDGNEIIIPPGSGVPDIARTLYVGAKIKNINAHWGLLNRDNKLKKVSLGVSDPMIFRSDAGLAEFKDHARNLLQFLVKWLADKGFPTVKDPKKGVVLPDYDEIWKFANPSHPKHGLYLSNLDELQFVLANADIMGKAAINRTVSQGWWVVSYSGKNAPNMSKFQAAIRAFEVGCKRLIRTTKFQTLFDKLYAEASDPMDTNPGYPYFEGIMDKDQNPVTRIKIIAEGRDLIAKAKARGKGTLTWKNMLAEVDSRWGKNGLEGSPLLIGVIRRNQPGNKPAHFFVRTHQGLKASHDEYGHNTVRVAWMVPWIYNLLITPFHCFVKAVRMLLPGMYHDGASRFERLAVLKKMHSHKRLFIAEADYSNYDRFMPVNLIRKLTEFFTSMLPDSEYWQEAAMYLHDDASFVWPDYMADGTSTGWIIKPGLLGLMSGVKLTSETGSFVNFIINLQAAIDAKKWSEGLAADYVSMYADSEVGKKLEYFYIQSDDSLLIAESAADLFHQGEAFTSCIKAAGLKGKVMVGDRFLMRHMNAGRDTPVPARVWQNTISNEEAPASPLIFCVGLGGRTDGLLGFKSVDPFNTGRILKVTSVESQFTRVILDSISHFIGTSAYPQRDALVFLSELKQTDASQSARHAVDKFRRDKTQLLAEIELKNAKSVSGYLASLLRDKHKPASAMMLDELMALFPQLKTKVEGIAKKEEKFFQYAAANLGIKPLSYKSIRV